MKTLLIILLALSLQMCVTKPQTEQKGCFTGKLVKRGICGQRVIQLVSESMDGIAFAANWTDSLSGKQYEKVFAVANSCDFPVSLKEGDTFNFRLTTTPTSDCIQCYAYTPVPEEKNNLVVGCAN